MQDEPEQKAAASAATTNAATTGAGVRVAAACWVLALFFFTGVYIPLVTSYLLLLAVLGLAGAILSVFDLVQGRKWALLGLVLSLTPFLLVMGGTALMSGGLYK